MVALAQATCLRGGCKLIMSSVYFQSFNSARVEYVRARESEGVKSLVFGLV